MAKVLGTELGNRVDQKLGTQPVTLVDIYWGNGVVTTYADKDYLYNSSGEPQIKGRILALSGLDSTIKLNGSNSSSISITLSDHDNEIRDLLNNNNITLISRKVVVRHAYDDLNTDAANTIVLFVGQITSPIDWGNRTLSFTVLNKLEDKEVGFSAEQGQFDFLSEEIVGKAWPLAIGQVKFIPTVKITSRTVGTSMTQYSIINMKEYSKLKELVQEYIQEKRTKEKLDTDRLDPEKRKIWCSDDEYKEVTDRYLSKWSELLNFYSGLLAQKPESQVTLKNAFDTMVSYWDKYTESKELYDELESINAELATDFSEFAGQDINQAGQLKVKWQAKKEELENRQLVINARLAVLAPLITTDEEQIATYTIDLLQFGLTELRVLDGKKFPQGESVDIVINGLVLNGTFDDDIFTVNTVKPTYGDIEFGTRVTDDPNLFWVENSAIYLKGQFIFIKKENEPSRLAYVIEQDGTQCTLYQILSRKIVDDPIEYEPILLDSSYQIYQTAGCALDTWFSWDDMNPNFISLKRNRIETGTQFFYDDDLDIDFEINIGDDVTKKIDYFDTYIANCVPLSHTPASEISEVCAYRNIRGEKKLVPIPTSYYTAYTSTTLDQLKVTAIELKYPLKEHRGEGWEDDIYISIKGGVFGNSSYDAIDLLIFFIEKYSTLTYDLTSFTATRAYVENMLPNFLLDERRNVLSLLEDIAWQCKCIIWVVNDVVYIKSLAHQTADVVSLTESDILNKQISYTDDSDVVTIFEAIYKKWYLPDSERKIILRNNIPIFGKRKREFYFFIFTDDNLVEHVATFWLLRYSNIWKRVRITTPIHTLRLEIYDQVGITLTDGIIRSDNAEFHGLIESMVYDITNLEISYDCWIPIRMQENTQYLWAFTADQVQLYPYPFPGLDNYPGGSSSGYNITTGNNFVFTTRPKDYGTQYPADFSLTPPPVKATIGQIDYSVLRKKPQYKKIIPTVLDINTEILDRRNGAKGKLKDVFKVVRGVPGKLATERRATVSESDIPFRHDKSYLTLDTNKPIYAAKIWQPADDYLPADNGSLDNFVAQLPNDQREDFFSSSNNRISFLNSKRLQTFTPNINTEFHTLAESIQDRSDIFLAKILPQVGGASVNRLKYDWEEVVLRRHQTVGVGESASYYVETKFEGRSSASHGQAINLIELFDDYNGVLAPYTYYGNGVKKSLLSTSPFTSMTLQPVGGGAIAALSEVGAAVIVVMYRMAASLFADDGIGGTVLPATQYVFQYENGISGTCPPV